ncbi:AI-2E family transporter [Cupriavidus oxalaticus]|uniref:AI-2E family transporter n=1 Tax=Cupriavidus oxalaticus TaxID=96344 RepID=A0A375FVA5_9BURK|nr:AI-2E family transporter [Cupriavidus oxalaticus]QEZ43228.1 AI-2E family transporter [Cupriavidus oxalaticus]QRQ85386.1 AI-2E family transporter [Cupriavidus oxalaticus]QRQ90526.1 AI-2E family transporter [Cupriavidus oxalaticus]WQD85046.1 AI-2E family transporter [Cupriavidus oxalaticus]SPC08407.1 Permease [Cupriavidus oxalaticus]
MPTVPDPASSPMPHAEPSAAAEVAGPAAPADAPMVAVAPATVSAALQRASTALVVLAVLFSLYAVHLARDFLVPVVIAIVLAYLLDPLVSALQRLGMPRVAAGTVVLLALLCALLSGAYLLQGQVESIINSLPEAASKLSRSVGALLSGDDSMWQKVRRAATVLSGAGQPPPVRVPHVVVDHSGDQINTMLVAGSVSIFTMAGQAVVVVFLLYFLLLAGDTFKRKFIKMVGNTISEKKISVHMLDEVNRSIQRYMGMLLVTNAALGACTWLLLKWLGVNNAGSWSLAAAALHLVPYFGAMAIAVCLGMVTFMQFGTLGMAAAAAGGSLLIATLIGSLVTTWMTGRMARMNAVAVFVALLLFTWLWGVWGMLLAIPLITIAKVVADHIEGLEVVAEFLGE